MESEDLFKQSFKYYKSKSNSLNMREVIDFELADDIGNDITPLYKSDVKIAPEVLQEVGLTATSTWKAYTVRDIPGLVFIKNPFTVVGQRYWVARSCRDFPKKPSKTNLDDLEVFKERDWWTVCHRVDKKYLYKLRWATFGYHHNWDTKVYSEDNKSPFPLDLGMLTKTVSAYLGYPQFEAEAAIVNYYYTDSNLSGHTDHSEINLEAPLFSFSFGRPAVFLIGGKTRSTKPQAIMIRTGDIIAMSGESRLFYHGIPKILNPDTYQWLEESPIGNTITELNHENGEQETIFTGNKLMVVCKEFSCLWFPCYHKFIENSRININVRQVLPLRQVTLNL